MTFFNKVSKTVVDVHIPQTKFLDERAIHVVYETPRIYFNQTFSQKRTPSDNRAFTTV